jgi:lysophospholipase L1-like esterase
VGRKPFDKPGASRFINTVTLVRRQLARVLLGLSALSVPSASAQSSSIASRSVAPAAVLPAQPREPLLGELSDDPAMPLFSPLLLRLRWRAQERILGRDQAVEDEFGRIVPARQIVLEQGDGPAPPNGNALGHFVPIENESSLAHFHASLEALSSRPEQKNKLRVAVYGASHTQADVYSGYLRYYLQSRFGNGGAGFIPFAVERSGSSRIDFKVRARGFKSEYVQQKPPPPHGIFGLSGMAAVGGPHGKLSLSPENETDPELTASQYSLFYAAEPSSDGLTVSVDGGPAVQLSARSPQLEARYHTFERPLGWHQIEIRTTGPGGARLFGLSVERAQPGIVIDTLGIRGTRAANMLSWDTALWEEHLRRRGPDLVLLAYGTNETTDRSQPIADYARELAQVLGKLRHALPDASCVLVGPGDFPKEENGSWSTRPRLLEIIREQRQLAPQFGCGFWDAYAFMGGEGSMAEWVRANPRLGAPDHIHLSQRGYVRMGLVLGDALLRAYDARHLPPSSRVQSQREAGAPASAGLGSAALP